MSAAEPSNDPKVEAKAHFRRGIEAYEAHRLSEAAAEFRMAYELSPAYKVLYNIGQVSAALGDAVAAVNAYESIWNRGAMKSRWLDAKQFKRNSPSSKHELEASHSSAPPMVRPFKSMASFLGRLRLALPFA